MKMESSILDLVFYLMYHVPQPPLTNQSGKVHPQLQDLLLSNSSKRRFGLNV